MRKIASIAKAARDSSSITRWLRMAPVRLRNVIKDAQQARERSASAAQVPTPAERRDQLIGFYQRYEQLVEILCDGAQYGPDGGLESRYRELRAWMQRHYPAMRGYMRPYLDDPGAKGRIEHHERTEDAFEVLFGFPTLDDLLRADDGELIGRIIRTRQALTVYGDHLRQLQVVQPKRPRV